MSESARETAKRIVRDAMNLGRHDYSTTRIILLDGNSHVLEGHNESIEKYRCKLVSRIVRLTENRKRKP